MACWMRFVHKDRLGFGTFENDSIAVYEGDLFSNPVATGRALARAEVKLETPCDPSKMICLWNNFDTAAAKFNWKEPTEPLYFLKAQSAFQPGDIRIQRTYPEKVIELG
jgi:2-keto-4-pentenoate hydratase/2-oxohepta-3-ene-1,7-dioic acid hydratase in catechol pathway